HKKKKKKMSTPRPEINEKVKRRLEMPQQMAPKLRARQIQVASWILSIGKPRKQL
ncbi:hypothetical protein BC940DRAFT_38519, partial [Gongronella butleri]